MTQQELFESQKPSRMLKILIPLLVAVGIIVIFRSGYEFGQWLQSIQH